MILVSGSLAYDYIMDFPGYFRDHILPKKLHVLSVSFLIDKMERNFGGTAGNIAYNLALLGEKPAILSSAGSDYAAYRKWQMANRIDVSRVSVVKNVPTAGAYIMTDKADNQITAFYPGAMRASVEAKVRQWLRQRYASGVESRSSWRKMASIAIVAPGNLEDMKTLPRLYKKHAVPYVYDPGQNIAALSGAQLRAGISGAKVFISNDYELAMVLKKTGWKKPDLQRKVPIVVTTLGERGSLVETSISNSPNSPNSSNKIPNSKFEIQKFVIPPARPKNTSDPTGAGDAYRAGFIKGLILGLPYDKVGKLASVVAVYTVEKYGTQTHAFTWQGLLKRYQTNYKEKLL